MRKRFLVLVVLVSLAFSALPASADDPNPYNVVFHDGPVYDSCIVELPDSPNAQNLGGLSGLRWDMTRGTFLSHTDNRTGSDNKLLLFMLDDVATPSSNPYASQCPRTLQHNSTHYLRNPSGTPLTNTQYDPEGIEIAADGTIWMVEEKYNKTLKVQQTSSGEFRVVEVIDPPADSQYNFANKTQGFEGVTLSWEWDAANQTYRNDYLYVTQQIHLTGETEGHAWILRRDQATGEWAWWKYILETPDPNLPGHRMGLHDAGWNGVDEYGNHHIVVLERDNREGSEARVKALYGVNLGAPNGQTGYQGEVSKYLVRDFLADDEYNLEKPEGISMNGDFSRGYVVNDNSQEGLQQVWILPLY